MMYAVGPRRSRTRSLAEPVAARRSHDEGVARDGLDLSVYITNAAQLIELQGFKMSKHARRKLQPTLKPLAAVVAALCGSGFVAAPAVAQIDRMGPANAVDDEMVVTATRRQATVQELPFNIAALDGAVLERWRVTTLNELSRIVPGMTVIDQGPRGASLMT